MWYSILKYEQVMQDNFGGNRHTIRAGSIFRVEKAMINGARSVKATSLYEETRVLMLTVDEARAIMTKPSSDIAEVHEEAIMICEGAYC